jgi:hypothetical protein
VPRELPPPLPPETRTVGQLVAESIRLYGRRFWLALPLGLSVAVLEQGLLEFDSEVRLLLLATIGGALLSVSYAGASALAADTRLTRRSAVVAIAAGALVFVPFPLLILGFILPGLAWLAFIGLVVPVAVIERLGFRAVFGRAMELARADYVHALGSLATLVILYVLTRLVLTLLLRDTGDQTERGAIFLADLVISPLLFLGAALLYFDQRARVDRRADHSAPRRTRGARSRS